MPRNLNRPRGKGLLSRFCATIREIRDFNREIYGTNRESVIMYRMRFEHRQLTARRLFARCFRPAVDHNEVGPRQLAPALVSDAAERSAGTADADGGLLAMLRRMTSQVGASIGGAADSGDLYSRTAAGSTDYSTAEHDRRCSQRRSFCAACDDTLVICDADPRGTIRQPRRCPCVAARGAKLPLSIFGLSRRRSNSTSLEAQDTFGDLISCLENVFELRVCGLSVYAALPADRVFQSLAHV
eukprot:SAG31_NODE_1691_length_7513_cov_11.746830_4_plen_242_part_00